MSFFKKLAKKLKKVVKVAAPLYAATSLPGSNFVGMAAGGDMAGGIAGIAGMLGGKAKAKMSPAMPGVPSVGGQDLGGVLADGHLGGRFRQRLQHPRRSMARAYRKAHAVAHRVGGALAARRRRRRPRPSGVQRARRAAWRRRTPLRRRRRAGVRRMSALQRRFFGRRRGRKRK